MTIWHKLQNKIRIFHIQSKGGILGSNCRIDSGTEIIFYRGFVMGDNCVLYKNNTVYNGKHGIFKMGSNSHSAPYGYYLIQNNKLTIGCNVAIGPFCSFFCVSNAIIGGSKLFRESYISGDIALGNNIFIGAHCVVLPGTVIGDNTAIAANSVIKGYLDSGYLYGGSPARKIKKLGAVC